jgi:hypothetical protein
MRQTRAIPLGALCAVLIMAVQIQAATQYTVTDLGDLLPVAVIDGPLVFGNQAGLPIVWQNGQVRALQHFGLGGQVNGVNARGDSVGYVWFPTPGQSARRVAAFWYPDGQVALLSGRGETEARGLNINRVIAGVDLTTGTGLRWVPGKVEETLPGYPPGNGSIGWAVDGMGRAWGNSGNLVIGWDVDGTAYDLIGQGGVQAGAGAGFATAGMLATQAAHFTLPVHTTTLPNLPGTRLGCGARAINNQHVTAGFCRLGPSSPSIAVVWPTTTTIQNLNEVASTPLPLETATGISEDGHLVGTSSGRGWLLTPQQAPPALALQLNQQTFRPGDTLEVSVEQNGGPADLHAAIILPDGETTLFLTRLDTLSYIVSTIPRGPYPVTAGSSLTHTWHALNEPGVYHIIAALSKPGSLADGRIDAGDIVALDWKAFGFGPGELLAGR